MRTEQCILLDGRELGRHEGIALSSFAFGPQGQWAYAARHGSRWIAHSSKGDMGEWDGIGEMRFSPVGDRLAFEAEREGKWTVVVDGKPGPWQASLIAGTLVFSHDGGDFAYATDSAGKTRVFLDQRAYPEGASFDGVGALHFDAGNLPAFAARRGDSAYAVWEGRFGRAYASISGFALDAEGGPAYLAVRDGATYFISRESESPPYASARNLVLSTDGRAYAFIVRVEGGEAVIANGKAGPVFDAIPMPVFSADGKRWGCSGRVGKAWKVIADGVVIATETWAGTPALGSGKRIAYAARREGRMVVVVDGTAPKAWKFDLVLDDTILFSKHGDHWGCIAGRGSDEKLFFVVDGRPWKPVDMVEVAGVAVRQPSDGGKNMLKEWMAAELELAGER